MFGNQVPVIELLEVVGKLDNKVPEHIGNTWVNVGTIGWLICIVIWVFVAHCPRVGVKVYSVVCVLFTAGAQVPIITLFEVVGKLDRNVPEQIGETWVNVGFTGLITVIVMAAVVAFCPAFGVKVYNVVAVLFNAGDQVPVIELLDIVGKAAKNEPAQIEFTWVKVGVIVAVELTLNVCVVVNPQGALNWATRE